MSVHSRRLQELEARVPRLPVDPVVLEVPHLLQFALDEAYLGVELYPRQATLLKVMGCSPELFTDYDRVVLDEWTDGFALADRDDGTSGFTGSCGVVGDVAARMDYCRARGRALFREVLLGLCCVV